MQSFVKCLTTLQLLQLTGLVVDELRNRDVARTGNNPIGDYTEWLVAKALKMKLEDQNSNKGFDATDDSGTRYEIKGRRITSRNRSLQLSAIRNIDAGHFDHLVAVIYDEMFKVVRALVIPRNIVKENSSYRAHTNSHALFARPELAQLEGVRDVTEIVSATHGE